MNNTRKYGAKKDDVIAYMFKLSYEEGAGFCRGNIKKYLLRYRNVRKLPILAQIWHRLNGKGNKADLKKAHDYFERWFCDAEHQWQRTVISEWYEYERNIK